MFRLTLILLHLVIGGGALAAGPALAAKPGGEVLHFRKEWLQGSPFQDYRIPGLVLTFLIGPTNLLSAMSQWRRFAFAPVASLGTGAFLLAWGTVQWFTIGYRHWSQAVWYLAFCLTTVMAVMQRLRAKKGST